MLLPSLAAAVVSKFVGPGIPYGLGWGPRFVQGHCHYGIVVDITVVHCESLSLSYCQWMEQPQLIQGSMGLVMVVHTIVLPAILQN